MFNEKIKIPSFIISDSGIKGFLRNLAESVGILMFSKYKYISDSTYTITDEDHKKILVFSGASVTVTLNDTIRNEVEILVIYDGTGTLTFSGLDKAINTTMTDQYISATLLRDTQGNWRLQGGA